MLLSVLELISSLLCLRLVLITPLTSGEKELQAMCFCKFSNKAALLSKSCCDLSKNFSLFRNPRIPCVYTPKKDQTADVQADLSLPFSHMPQGSFSWPTYQHMEVL